MDAANPNPSGGAPSWVSGVRGRSGLVSSGSYYLGLWRPPSEVPSSVGGGSARPPKGHQDSEAVGSSDLSSESGSSGQTGYAIGPGESVVGHCDIMFHS